MLHFHAFPVRTCEPFDMLCQLRCCIRGIGRVVPNVGAWFYVFFFVGGDEYVVPRIPPLLSSMQHKDWKLYCFLVKFDSNGIHQFCLRVPQWTHKCVSIQCIKSDMINMSSCRFGNQNVRYLEVSLVGWRMRLRSARSFASKATTLHCILDLTSFKGIMSTQYELGCWINQTGLSMVFRCIMVVPVQFFFSEDWIPEGIWIDFSMTCMLT